MQNQRKGIHSNKIITTKYNIKYLTTYSANLPNQQKYLGYLKKLSLGVCSLCFLLPDGVFHAILKQNVCELL